MRKKLTFLFALLCATTLTWADPTVLFHETFGNNTGSARNWSDSYSVKSGIEAVYSGITSYTVSNAKQGKNTTGSTQSGLNQVTANTDAYIIIGPLSVANYESLEVTYQWKAASVKGTYTTALYYATSSTGTYTEVSGTGAGATTFVERSYSLPAAAQVATLYLKIVWNTSNTQAIIDEVELTGSASGGGDPTPTCATPTFSPAAGSVVSGTTVTISSSTDGATIYYTMGNNPADPTTSDATYSTPIEITAATTIKAIAVKDGYDNSSVASASYTIVTPYTTIADLYNDKTGSNQSVYVTFGGWQVSAVKGNQAFVTDGTNGLIIYQSGHGLTEGDVLTGTVPCTLVDYNGAAELKGITKTMDGLTVTSGTINPVVKTVAQANTLGSINTGLLIKLENVTYNGSALADASSNTITPSSNIYSYSWVNNKEYNVTGIFQIYNSSNQIYPRKEADVELVTSKILYSIAISGNYPTVFEQGDAFSHAGMTVTATYTDNSEEDVTNSATFTGYNMSTTGAQTVTVSYTENNVEKTTTYSITVNTPAPTGDWEEFSGALSDLTDGDYLIFDNSSLMKAEIASSRFNYETVTPDANGIISNPSSLTIWTITTSGSYKTFYNSKSGKYAASTGVSGKAQLLEDGTDDKAKWSISNDLVITNKYNSDQSVNATLRHNYNSTDNYGFACYGASTGGKPVFYKQAIPSYSITETLTGCAAHANNATKVPQTLTDDVELKYTLTTGYVWPDNITVEVGGVALDPANVDYLWDNTKSPAELTIAKEKVTGNIAITITATLKTLSSITIAQAPTNVDYETGEFFNPAGLQIQLNYTAGDPDIVEYNNETKNNFTFSPDLETALTTSDNEVTITYGGQSVAQTITVTDPVAVVKTVVIIAEYDNNLYAMSNVVSNKACEAIPVTKNSNNIVVASEDDKAAIQWTMSKLGSTIQLQDTESAYLSSSSGSGDLSTSANEVNWTLTQSGANYLIAIGSTRSLMYRDTGVFKHYATSNTTGYAKISEIFEVATGATNIVVDSSMTTSLDDVETGVAARKYIENGVLYIEREGKIYNVMGVQVK